MSNYFAKAKRKLDTEYEYVQMLDNYYGKHKYGVLFLDNSIVKEEDCDILVESSIQEPSTSDADIKSVKQYKDEPDTFYSDIIKEFRDKFVVVDNGPDGDGYDCEPNQWIEYFKSEPEYRQIEKVEEFILDALNRKPYRENDISAWKNYDLERNYFDFFEAQIREEVKQELRKNIGMLRQYLNERTDDKLLTNEDLETFLLK
jgi:hypothetical protein